MSSQSKRTESFPTEQQQCERIEDLVRLNRMRFDMMAKSMHGAHPWALSAVLTRLGKPYYFSPESFERRKYMKPKECFMNATLLAFQGIGTYVEGEVNCFGVPIHHAWITTNGRDVIEPTLTDHNGLGGYLGVAIQTRFLRKALLTKKTYTFFDHDNEVLMARSTIDEDWIQSFSTAEGTQS